MSARVIASKSPDKQRYMPKITNINSSVVPKHPDRQCKLVFINIYIQKNLAFQVNMNAKNTQKHITRSVDIPGHCETDIDMDVINDHLNCDDITNFINNSKIIYFYDLI